jgi:hypothetical protein
MKMFSAGSVVVALVIVGLACGNGDSPAGTDADSQTPETVTFDQLFSDPDRFNGKETVLTGFYFHGFETIVLAERMEYTDFAEGHLWPKGRMIWVEGDLVPDVYDQLYTQDMIGPLERYAKLRVRGRFEHGGTYGHAGGFTDQIVPMEVELLPRTPVALLPDYSIADLKYSLIDHFGGVLIGDPVLVPDHIRREQAVSAFATIQQDGEEFQAILGRLDLSESASYTEEQQVLVFEEKKKLNAVLIEPSEGGHSFDLAVREEGEPIRVYGTIGDDGDISVLTKEQALLPR